MSVQSKMEDANGCDLSMHWPWNSLLLEGKRNLLHAECVSDSQQMTLSPYVSGGETKFAVGHLPNLFKLARDLQMHAVTAVTADECCKNIKVEAEVICFVCLIQAPTCVNNLHNGLQKQEEMQLIILICVIWSFSPLCCSFLSELQSLGHVNALYMCHVYKNACCSWCSWARHLTP